MARVTIEDCLEKVDDRFELVSLASQRAKDISSGAEITIDRNGEKDTVISLREIATGNVTIEDLREEIVNYHQKERQTISEFTEAPVQGSSSDDSIEIENEDADIQAAIAEASETGIDHDEEPEENNFAGGLDPEASDQE